MSTRLPLVISQATQASAADQATETAIIGRLIGYASIDVHLVGPLANATSSQTDQLVLEGIKGDFALLAWHPAKVTFDLLTRMGISGQQGKHARDPNSQASSSERRIYCLDHNDYPTPDAICAALVTLLQNRQVITVPMPQAPIKNSPKNPEPPSHSIETSILNGPSRSPIPEHAPPATEDIKDKQTLACSETDNRSVDSDLDHLVDALNKLDI